MHEKNEIVLLISDEFKLCPNAFKDLISMYYWANSNKKTWKAVRMSYTFNGLFLQCNDLPEIVHVLRRKCQDNNFNNCLGDHWSDKVKTSEKYIKERILRNRLQYVFKYNLFQRLNLKTEVQCYGELEGNLNVNANDEFSSASCPGMVVSPCHNNEVETILRYLPDSMKEKNIFLTLEARKNLFNFFNSKLYLWIQSIIKSIKRVLMFVS